MSSSSPSAHVCEVCAALALSETDGARAPAVARPTRRMLIEERVLSLCDQHAAVIELARVRTLDELRELFRETEGRRALLQRRAALDRRMFPPRPEGRRMGGGRRVSDVEL